jgi:hypothetical protein
MCYRGEFAYIDGVLADGEVLRLVLLFRSARTHLARLGHEWVL